jgi:hypothetical protein
LAVRIEARVRERKALGFGFLGPRSQAVKLYNPGIRGVLYLSHTCAPSLSPLFRDRERRERERERERMCVWSGRAGGGERIQHLDPGQEKLRQTRRLNRART